MKKFLGIVLLGLFISVNPLAIKFSYAGLLDIFNDPTEVCMDRLINGGYTAGWAADACSGSTRATLKCMDRLINEGYTAGLSAKQCTGKN